MDDKRILGLDIGERHTGVAVSDESKTFAFPLTTIHAYNKRQWIAEVIKVLTAEENIESIVVGLPLTHDGEEGRDAKNMQTYVALLQEKTKFPVIQWDERFTTVEAERYLLEADVSRSKRKEVIDKVAATIILQNYLDSKKYGSK
jgi:putative Holliday junction resolvase